TSAPVATPSVPATVPAQPGTARADQPGYSPSY
ncbi:MAG: formate/nitrite transporter family protein, partial [Nitrospira sp.]